MIKGVVRTEKALKLTTKENTIPFVVDSRATKQSIKDEVEKLFNAKVDNVRTHIVRGRKVAYVKFAKDVNVEELATSLNVA
ncbi:MAG: 50S ribosomal protein L23 [Methanobacteriota archaeon]|nr:MAG: 50S ribosomal protein L23 [Euryarchaeota archaeon]